MLNNVSLQIRNPEDGQLVSCWINLRDSHGTDHGPDGWVRDFSLVPGEDVGGRCLAGGRKWFAISGSCEVPGGLGECQLTISRAPGFNGMTVGTKLFPGRLACRISFIPPKIPPGNWIGADFRTHSCGVGALLVEGQASGIQLVALVAGNDLDPQASKTALGSLAEMAGFGGACDRGGILIGPGTLNQQKKGGSLVLLDSHRPVLPLRIDETNRRDWSLMDWTGQGHRVRGVTVWADQGRDSFHCGEALCAVILGEIDLFEVANLDAQREGGLKLWHELAGGGFPIPLVGGSGKDSNAKGVGSLRTWVDLAETGWSGKTATEKQSSWVGAVKAGRTMVSLWPFVQITNLRVTNKLLELEYEIRGAIEGTSLEVVLPSGEILVRVHPLSGEIADKISVKTGDIPPDHLAARLVDERGRIVTQGGFHPVPGGQASQWVREQAIGRLVERIQKAREELETWEDGSSGINEISYRRQLFEKGLMALKGKAGLP